MNKIDRYVLGAALALCSASAVQAQGLENIIVEDYYTISQADADAYNGGFGGGGFPLVAGMKCYRIYVDMAPGYKLNQVFGSPTPQGGGASPNPLDITTTTTFWNDDNWGSEFPSQTRRLPQGAAFDSYITVNTTGTGSTGTTCGSTAAQFGVLRSADTNGNLTMCTVYPGFSGNDGNVPGTGPALTTNLSGTLDFSALRADGSSFVVVDDSWTTLPTSQGVDPTGTNRVLIGQFTTDGALSFKLNVQLSSPTSQLETYVHTTAGAGETVSPLLTYPQSLPPDCLGVPGGTAQPGTACDDGNAATGNDTWNANCVCVGQTIDCAGVPGGTALPGTACDDGNASTGNDTWNASCVCVGQTIDCAGVPGGTALPGTACDDGNASTGNDVYGANCVCAGQTIDCLGVPGGTALPGTACDDGNASTGNDVYGADCVCAGQTIDCLGVPGGTALPGTACDDGNASTGNDVYGANCVCAGQLIDCLGVPGGTALIGSPCDDGNASTTNDAYNADCVCEGSTVDCNDNDPCTADSFNGTACVHTPLPDTDSDGTCDLIDGCPTDPNKIAPGICGCGVPDVDTDSDGVADCQDSCPNLAGQVGSTCDDGNAQTVNDTINANCVCVGTPLAGDCLGVPGGTALPGTACDDDDATTENDTWNANCVCVGTSIFDCPALQADFGDACDDGDATTENDVVGTDCVCAGTSIYDCPVLQANIGDACDDGNASTINDVVTASCVCAGIPSGCTEDLTLAIKLDAFGSQTTWNLKDANTNVVVDQGGPYANGAAGQTITENICVPMGCYHLEVMDSGNNGITNGGYVLRDAQGRRIIDATGNFGGTSEILGSNGTVEAPFCLPISNADMLPGTCDQPSRFVQSPVYTSNYPGASSYQFWIFDPHGSYTRMLATTTRQFTPANLQTLPVPVNVDLNIRVRPMVNGSYLEFGPACRYRFIPNAAHRDNDGRVLMFDDAGVTMTLYPNPNRGGTVYLRMDGLAEATTPVDITIYDALGQQVHAERTVEADGSLNHAMDLGRTLGAGMYVVNVTIGEQRFTQRLVMQ